MTYIEKQKEFYAVNYNGDNYREIANEFPFHPLTLSIKENMETEENIFKIDGNEIKKGDWVVREKGTPGFVIFTNMEFRKKYCKKEVV